VRNKYGECMSTQPTIMSGNGSGSDDDDGESGGIGGNGSRRDSSGVTGTDAIEGARRLIRLQSPGNTNQSESACRYSESLYGHRSTDC
jgi:hypothetical protein